MNLDFDLNHVSVTEFGIGQDAGEGQNFVAMPVGADVQAALCDIALETWNAMQ